MVQLCRLFRDVSSKKVSDLQKDTERVCYFCGGVHGSRCPNVAAATAANLVSLVTVWSLPDGTPLTLNDSCQSARVSGHTIEINNGYFSVGQWNLFIRDGAPRLVDSTTPDGIMLERKDAKVMCNGQELKVQEGDDKHMVQDPSFVEVLERALKYRVSVAEARGRVVFAPKDKFSEDEITWAWRHPPEEEEHTDPTAPVAHVISFVGPPTWFISSTESARDHTTYFIRTATRERDVSGEIHLLSRGANQVVVYVEPNVALSLLAQRFSLWREPGVSVDLRVYRAPKGDENLKATPSSDSTIGRDSRAEPPDSSKHKAQKCRRMSAASITLSFARALHLKGSSTKRTAKV